MKEKTGKVFRIAEDNQPVAGCTISKEVYASGQDYISYFSLAKDTDISAEIYGYHKLLILHEGGMEVYCSLMPNLFFQAPALNPQSSRLHPLFIR